MPAQQEGTRTWLAAAWAASLCRASAALGPGYGESLLLPRVDMAVSDLVSALGKHRLLVYTS